VKHGRACVLRCCRRGYLHVRIVFKGMWGLLQVKLLKCLVDNIVVDISFNQMGGLITLNFLEEINNLIGNSNIFKRSIILVREPPAPWVSTAQRQISFRRGVQGRPASVATANIFHCSKRTHHVQAAW